MHAAGGGGSRGGVGKVDDVARCKSAHRRPVTNAYQTRDKRVTNALRMRDTRVRSEQTHFALSRALVLPLAVLAEFDPARVSTLEVEHRPLVPRSLCGPGS